MVCVDEDEVIPSVMPLTSATCDATNTLINNLVNDIIGNNGVEEVKEKPVIVVESMGRLGNELFQYFSTLGVAKSFDATPCFPPGSFSDLTAMYPSIHTNSSCPTDNLVSLETECCYATHDEFYGSIVLEGDSLDYQGGGYRQSYRYFDNIDIHSVLGSPNEDLVADAKSFLAPQADKVKIAIHLRRGDHLNLGYMTFPDQSYFDNSMKYFRSKYEDCVFIVASDDLSYAKELFSDETDVVFSEPSSKLSFDRHSPNLDMLILSSCNHMIMSLGTYSWWSAHLLHSRVHSSSNQSADSMAEIVYFKNEFNLTHAENKIHGSLWAEFGQGSKIVKSDYYPEQWTGME